MVRNTGVGSLPGIDIVEALKVVSDVHSDLLFLPELPARGPGADMIGRTAALLAGVATDLAIETTPTGWKFADAPGLHVRRALSWLQEDLERVEELVGDSEVQLKLQLTGPVTLAASIALPRGERAIRDGGAVDEISAAHREAAVLHLRDVRRRLPNARLILQIDEPALDSALRGTIPNQSGFGRLRSLAPRVVSDIHRALATDIVAADVVPWMHSCAPNWPLELVRTVGYRGISGDAGLLTDADDEQLGQAIEAGLDIVAGVIPTDAGALAERPVAEDATVAPIRWRYQRLGLADRLRGVVITPTCGLGRTPWPAAKVAMRRTVEAAKALAAS